MAFRLLEIQFVQTRQLKPIHQWEFQHQQGIIQRRIKIYYTRGRRFEISLYGMDKTLKWKTTKRHDLDQLFAIIDAMPIPMQKKNTRRLTTPTTTEVYRACGISGKHPFTHHCFRDVTHQTCCLLGGRARQYADRSGNPIGRASEEEFRKNYGFPPDENTLTPWCTCIGSQACTYYSQKFGKDDGTHIKFLHQDGKIVDSDQEESYARIRHRTPGISSNII